MKTFFTLLFTTAMLSTAFAQYSQRDDRDRTKENDVYVSNDNRGYDNDNGFDKHNKDYKGRYFFTPRDRDMQISQINREYDYRMRTVRNHFYMNRYQKMRQISFLEDQCNREIQAVVFKFNDRRNQFNKDNRRYRRDW